MNGRIFDPSDFSVPLPRGATLLEASAGTGKTYALSAIYLRLLLFEKVSVRQILVTTFTVAATAELRTRIRLLLREGLDGFGTGQSDNPLISAVLQDSGLKAEEARQTLRDALADFDEAAIFTIHGFCQRVLSDRAFESGSLLGKTLLSSESNLVHEVALDYWRQRFYHCSPCLSAALHAAKLEVGTFEDLFLQVLTKPRANVIPLGEPGDFDILCRQIDEAFEECRAAWHSQEQELRRVFSAPANAWAKGRMQEEGTIRERFDSFTKIFAGDGVTTRGYQELTFFSQPDILRFTRAKHSAPVLSFFSACEKFATAGARFRTAVSLDFLHWAPAQLAARKSRVAAQTFGDLLSDLLTSLEGAGAEAMTAAVRDRYHAALVDEFQDTDPLQDLIFTRLFDHPGGWLFLIGDPKQAIYSFRGADVFTYLAASRRVGPERAFTLGTNFRSAERLVRATNTLFQQSPHAFQLSTLHFKPVESGRLREHETFSGDTHGPLRIWNWDGDAQAHIDLVRLEIAQAVAAEIARLLAGTGHLGSRKVKPRDIAVLTLKNAEAELMQETLTALGIPTVLQKSGSIFETSDARALLELLTAVAEPGREDFLRAALLTRLLGCDFGELDRLSRDEVAWEHRAASFRRWHQVWLRRGFMSMFRGLIHEANVSSRLLGRPDGERRLTNLQHLAELIQQAALEEHLGIAGTLRWLRKQLAAPDKGAEEQETRLESDDEAVRIITIHKSKGLEFEIVFCPFLIRDPGQRGAVSFHDDSGQAVIDLGTGDLESNKEQAMHEQLADDVRLLYVSLTRARQRCDFVWGHYKGADASALGTLLHPLGVPGLPEKKSLYGRPAGELQAELEALVATSHGAISLVPLPSPEAPAYRPEKISREKLSCRRFQSVIPRDLCVSSFSSLTASLNPELPDYDPSPPEPYDQVAEPALPQGIHAFPGGKRTGILVHGILEGLDFTDSSSIEPAVYKELERFSLEPDAWRKVLSTTLRHTLELPLPDGFRLCDLPAKARRPEIEFHLPAGNLDAVVLSRILQEDGSTYDFPPRRGWLKGFIDLVAEHQGRFYLFDWKTNRLGDSSAAYGAEALSAAMSAHHYGLQLHLYTLALHRYLAKRLRSYSYEKHFGGAYYLFLRGIDPADPRLGVVRQKPALKTIEALERWLGSTQQTLF